MAFPRRIAHVRRSSPRRRRCRRLRSRFATALSHRTSVDRRRRHATGRGIDRSRSRRARIRASASRPDCGTPARPRGTCAWSRTPGRRSNSRGRRTPTSRSSATYVIQGNYNGFQVWDISNPSPSDAQDRLLLPGLAERRVGLQEPAVRLGRGADRRASTAATGACKDTVSKERLRGIRIFDITRHRAPEARRQRADVPRIAHAHGAGRSEGPGQRLRLCLGLVGAAFAERARRAASARSPSKDPNSSALPHRGHQGPARASRAGRDRQLAAHLQRSRAGAGAWPGRRRQRRRLRRGTRERRVRRQRSAWSSASCPATSSKPMLDSIVKARGGTGASDGGRQRGAARGDLRASSTRCSASQRRRDPMPARRSATTSPSIRQIGLRRRRVRGLRPAARHPATRRTRCASTPSPTRTSRTGTRRRSTTTARRSSSPTSGAAAARRSAARRTPRTGAPTRSSRSTNQQDDVPELLQDAGAADAAGELRRAQRLARSRSRAAT